ncbi:unnamed protein product, partial [marine sediment metagenome]
PAGAETQAKKTSLTGETGRAPPTINIFEAPLPTDVFGAQVTTQAPITNDTGGGGFVGKKVVSRATGKEIPTEAIEPVISPKIIGGFAGDVLSGWRNIFRGWY